MVPRFSRSVLLALLLLPWLFAWPVASHPQAQGALSAPAAAQPEKVASYTIDVVLEVNQRRLEATQTITYRNTTRTPIPDLVFHLYLNAFKSEDTLFAQEGGGSSRGFASDPTQRGWIEVDSLQVDGLPLRLELLQDGTLARARLPEPIAPGEALNIEIRYHAQLPRVFARTGWAFDQRGDPFFMVAQWFPKLGVWTEQGWNAHPYHVNAEYFANFGDYEVQITLPRNYVTGATGLQRGAPVERPDGTQTVTYRAENVIDFAWSASPNYRSTARVVTLPNGARVDLVYLYLPEHDWSQADVLDSAASALERFSAWFGPYPYPNLTIVDVPDEGQGAGGMEYPTFIATDTNFGGGSDASRSYFVKAVTVHEVAHQWWQSVVATNEAEEPWLDEGFADYSTSLWMLNAGPVERDGNQASDPYVDRRRRAYLGTPDVPMFGKAWDFSPGRYGLGVYAKPNLGLLTLQGVLGTETMLQVMSTYYQRYQFAHPTTEDFRRVAEQISGQNLDWFFGRPGAEHGFVYGKGTLNYVAAEIQPNAITIERQGQAYAPVEVLVRFGDGGQQTVRWDGSSPSQTFTFDHPAPVESFTIDPDGWLVIETLWTDNVRVAEPAALQIATLTPTPEVAPTLVLPGTDQVTPTPSPALPPSLPETGGLGPQTAPTTADVVLYAIDVTLLPDDRRLDGAATIIYQNISDAPIPDLVFHLYLNAFRDENSLFMRESGGASRGYQADPSENGWIEVTDLRLLDGTLLTLEPLEDGTLARARLPQPIAPGEAVQMDISFTAQLPRVFARTGWAVDRQGDLFFMVAQWFPKLGVWTGQEWNAYPFHANAEFFANFGRYDVNISLPPGYHVAAVGQPGPVHQNPAGGQTLNFYAEKVIDFAFAASPNFRFEQRRVRDTEILYAYLPEHAWSVERVLDAAENALLYFSDWYGPYPYPRLTVVDVPDAGSGAGGMEYPTLITAGAMDFTGTGGGLAQRGWERTLETVVIHEVAHQWWQSMVGFNEVEEPWLDEGFTDYSTVRLMNALYGEDRSFLQIGNLSAGYLDMRRAEYLFSSPAVPMYGPAFGFEGAEYGVAAYAKPALALLTLERVLGEELMDRVMSTFFRRYQYGHPTTRDFQQVAQQVTGQDLAWFFGDPQAKTGLVYGPGTINYRAVSIAETSFTVGRTGDLAIPVDIEVTYADGTRAILEWDGSQPENTFTLDQPLHAFHIDPQRKLVIELVWSDNGLSRRPDLSAWLSLVTRFVYRLQDWLLVLGGI